MTKEQKLKIIEKAKNNGYKGKIEMTVIVQKMIQGITGVCFSSPFKVEPELELISREIELSRLVKQIEEYLGCPQNIEWVLGDKLYILQSRPITYEI